MIAFKQDVSHRGIQSNSEVYSSHRDAVRHARFPQTDISMQRKQRASIDRAAQDWSTAFGRVKADSDISGQPSPPDPAPQSSAVGSSECGMLTVEIVDL